MLLLAVIAVVVIIALLLSLITRALSDAYDWDNGLLFPIALMLLALIVASSIIYMRTQ